MLRGQSEWYVWYEMVHCRENSDFLTVVVNGNRTQMYPLYLQYKPSSEHTHIGMLIWNFYLSVKSELNQFSMATVLPLNDLHKPNSSHKTKTIKKHKTGIRQCLHHHFIESLSVSKHLEERFSRMDIHTKSIVNDLNHQTWWNGGAARLLWVGCSIISDQIHDMGFPVKW